MTFNDKYNEPVSVIIPVYNVEKYIERCLNSVISQTYPYLEIVVVNNMSTDKSWDIVSGIASGDTRFILAQCMEQGLSQTRNMALELCSGKWITFLDSDDILDERAIEKMLKRALETDSDVVAGAISLIDSNDKVLKRYSLEEYYSKDKENFLKFSLTRFINRSSVWGRLFKSTLLADKRFIPGLYSEDHPFLYSVLADASSFATVSDTVYNYRELTGSMTKRAEIRKQYEGALAAYNIALNYEDMPGVQPFFYGAAFKMLGYLLGSGYKYRKEDRDNWKKAISLTKSSAKKGQVTDFLTKFSMFLFIIFPSFATWLFHIYYELTYGKWTKSK